MAKSKNFKTSMAKADKYFSRYIRLLHADDNGYCRCVTSGKRFFWKEIHCGHFQSRRFMATRYDPMNCAPQSAYDNTYRSGEQYKFAKYIDAKYGEGTADELEQKARKTLVEMTQIDLEYIAESYRELSKAIANEKGIQL